MSKEKVCFVISQIGEEGSEARRRSDQVLTHIIQIAAKQCGYTVIRSDKISEPGIITSQIIQHLLDDPLVLPDLTDHNANVFYELAIRHAIRKPVVQMIEKGQKIPFDVAASRTIQVNHQDLDSAEQARQELVKQIHSAEQDPGNVDTPISIAIDLQLLRQSGNPLEKSSAEIMSLLQTLNQRIDVLTDRFRTNVSGYPTSSSNFSGTAGAWVPVTIAPSGQAFARGGWPVEPTSGFSALPHSDNPLEWKAKTDEKRQQQDKGNQ